MAALHARAFTVPRPWGATEFADLLTSIHVFAVTEPAGFAVGRAVAGEAELLTIAVAPEQRRQGVGRQLLDRIEAVARLRRSGRLLLEVAADNLPAIALYHSAGFRPEARRPGYYRHPDGSGRDALILAKALAAH